MNKSVLTVLAVAALLGACGRKAEEATTDAPAAAASAAEKPVVRQATYDPNLKPAQIVWDSPEKKARWEAMQRAKGAAGAAPAQAAAPTASAAKR